MIKTPRKIISLGEIKRREFLATFPGSTWQQAEQERAAKERDAKAGAQAGVLDWRRFEEPRFQLEDAENLVGISPEFVRGYLSAYEKEASGKV